MTDGGELNTVELATELTVAWLSNPNTRTSMDDVPAFLQSMHAALANLAKPAEAPASEPQQEHTPAVSARKSLASPEHIISLIDGKPYRSLKRHLTANGLTPDEYRARYNLKSDYPMVAPAYSEARRATAKLIGLGRKPGQTVKKAVRAAAKTTRKSSKAALQAAKEAPGTAE